MFDDLRVTDSEVAATPAAPPGPALVIDLNFLPERYRRHKLTLKAMRPALFALGFALLLIPLSRYWTESRSRLLLIEDALARVQAELQGYEPLAEERTQLETRIESAQAASAEIQAAYETVNIQNTTWNRLILRSLAAVPARARIDRLAQSGEEVVFEGIAEAYALPSIYADSLRGLGDYGEVIIQSITRIEQEEAEAMLAAEAEKEEGEERDTVEGQASVFPAYRFQISALLPMEPEAESASDGFEGGDS